jgi:YD repeat-containing protein
LRLQPFELLDTQSGNIMLTIPMLSLPGNAGRTLDFRLTYNANVMTVGVAPWVFGIAGMPMRVDEQATPDPRPDLPITLAETWGITPLVHMADGGTRRTMFTDNPRASTRMAITSSFWKYDRDDNKLYIPDGTICTYAGPNGRLTEIRDVYGNTVTLTWGADTLLVEQHLGTQSRAIEFDLNPKGLPTVMRFDGQTWGYRYENGNDDDLTSTIPPVGPGWRFEYGVPIAPIRRLTSVTTPHGGRIEYEYSPHYLTPTSYQVLLDVRRTTDRGSSEEHEWRVDYEPIASGYSERTTVTTPTGRRLTYVYGPVWLSNPEVTRPDVLIDGTIVLDSTTLDIGGPPVESEQRTYRQLPTTWWPDGTTHFDAVVPAQREISRAGRTYRTTLAYGSAGPLDNFGDYHQPSQITEEGELSRAITRSYFHGATPYVRGQISSETVSVGAESWTRTWSYETATGFKTRQTEFGATADAGIPTTFARDDRGNVAAITSATDKTTTFDYSWGQVSATHTPEYTKTRSINVDGTVASETSAGRTTSFTYEPHYDTYRLQRTQPPGGTNPILIDYDLVNGAWVRTTRGPSIETTWVDGFSRPIQIDKDSIGVSTRTEYDPEGRVVYEGYPFSGPADIGAVLEYDALHRVTRRTNPDGTSSTRTYEPGTVTVVDEQGRATLQKWGAFGDPDQSRLLSVRDAGGQTWDYAYHALGQLWTVTAPDLTTRRWLYNAQNRLSRETHPESGVTDYVGYDAAGNLTRKRDANGTTFDYTYDSNHRLRTITAASRVTTITYEPGSDHRISTSNGDVSSTFVYDAAGRLAQRRDEVSGYAFTTSYGYSGNDHVTSTTYPSGRTVGFDRDGAGRATRIFETAAGRDYALGITYHQSGALATYTAGNGVVTAITYTPDRYWTQSITAGPFQLTYGPYDAVGNVLTVNDSRPGMGHALTYDPLDRLDTVTGPSYFIEYEYDAHGNRVTSPSSTYVYDAATLRLIEQNGASFTYDNNGNLRTTPSGTFTYTEDNLLASAVTTGGSTTTYAYDPDTWRVKRTTSAGTTYYMRGLQGELLSEFKVPMSGGATARDYVYLGSRLVSAVEKPITLVSNSLNGTIIPNGPSVTQSVPVGKRLLLQFTGIAGHRYRAAARLTAGDFGCGAWLELRSATGELVANAATNEGCSTVLLEPVVLPASGTYFVVLDPLGAGTGTATTFLYDIYGTITPDGPSVSVTAANGQAWFLEFQAVAGQRYSIVSQLTSGTFGTGGIAVRTAHGVGLLFEESGSTNGLKVIVSHPVSSSSVHLILVDPSGTSTATTDLRLYNVVDVMGAITPGGAPVTVTTTTPGQRALLTFTGGAGQRVAMRLSNSSYGQTGYNVDIFRPEGYSLTGGGLSCYGTCSFSFFDTRTLPVAGQYTVVVNPSRTATGSLTLTLYDVPPDVTATMTPGGPAVTVMTTAVGQNALLTFTGTAGRRIALRSTGSTYGSCALSITVRTPSNATLAGATCVGTTTFIDTRTLPTNGVYTITVDPQTVAVGSVTLTLYDVPPDITGTITPGGSAVAVTTTAVGQNALLTFPGTVNQRVSVRNSGGTYGACRASLWFLKPDGSPLGAVGYCAGSNEFINPVTLPAAGTYTLKLDPSDTAVGSVTLTLYDVPPDVTGSIAIGDPPTTMTMTVPGQNGRFTFAGTAGQLATVRVTANAIGTTTVRLRRPDGSSFTSAASSASSFNLPQRTLPVTGTYMVEVDPSGANTGSLAIQVTSP